MDRALRVLFIVSSPTSSPAISVHANLMRFLDRDRVAVHVVYNRLAGVEPYRSEGSALDVLQHIPGIHLRPAEFGPVGGIPRPRLLAATARAALPGVRDSAALVSHIRAAGIDVIHCEEGTRNAGYALGLARLTPARCIVHFHSQYGSWMSRASRFAVRHADAVIPVSRWTGRGIAGDGVGAERIFPVLNGIDPAGYDPATTSGVTVRREFGIAPEDPLVVMGAQLAEWKRQHVLIEAFHSVAAAFPRARLLLAGTEWNPRGGYTARLARLVADLGLGQAVIFAGFRRDVHDVFAAADVFALPAVGEPFGLVLTEAMALARPVVAVSAGGVPEVVSDGETGLLSTPDDPGALAANLLALIRAPERRRQMGEQGRRRVLDYFNVRRMADEIEAVYRLVCGLETVPDADT